MGTVLGTKCEISRHSRVWDTARASQVTPALQMLPFPRKENALAEPYSELSDHPAERHDKRVAIRKLKPRRVTSVKLVEIRD